MYQYMCVYLYDSDDLTLSCLSWKTVVHNTKKDFDQNYVEHEKIERKK